MAHLRLAYLNAVCGGVARAGSSDLREQHPRKIPILGVRQVEQRDQKLLNRQALHRHNLLQGRLDVRASRHVPRDEHCLDLIHIHLAIAYVDGGRVDADRCVAVARGQEADVNGCGEILAMQQAAVQQQSDRGAIRTGITKAQMIVTVVEGQAAPKQLPHERYRNKTRPHFDPYNLPTWLRLGRAKLTSEQRAFNEQRSAPWNAPDKLRDCPFGHVTCLCIENAHLQQNCQTQKERNYHRHLDSFPRVQWQMFQHAVVERRQGLTNVVLHDTALLLAGGEAALQAHHCQQPKGYGGVCETPSRNAGCTLAKGHAGSKTKTAKVEHGDAGVWRVLLLVPPLPVHLAASVPQQQNLQPSQRNEDVTVGAPSFEHRNF